MKKLRLRHILFLAGAILGIILWGPVMMYGEDTGSKSRLPEGMYIELTKDFYKALRDEETGEANVYTNDPSNRHLKQIAISTRFMVETNLQILKQQETMNQLLQSILLGKKR